MNDVIPEGLHPMQYAVNILEEQLGWPAKGNQELICDCLKAIAKSRRLSDVHAYKYLLRAIWLAHEQRVTVDRYWFMEGKYTAMRPTKEAFKGTFKPIDKAATIAEQSKPEWEEESRKVREKLAMLAGKKKMP